MAVTINIPSQVKTYANLAAFPASGSLKTIYIAEDTNKTYRWDGSTYVEISASAATGLSVGTTPIASGTVGRVLFEGTGNVVQESANLFWDNTNARLGIGTSSPSTTFAIGSGGINRVNLGLQAFEMYTPSSVRTVFLGYSSTSGQLIISSGGSNDVNFLGGGFKSISTGNFAIGSTTDAGFRLDVNGTARVQAAGEVLRVQGTTATGNSYVQYRNSSGNLGYIGWGSSVTDHLNIYNEKNADAIFGTNNIERLRILSGGNVGVGTSTSSSGFSGNARVLSIVDNATSNVGSFRAYGGGTTTSIELFGSASLVGLYGHTNHPMTFWTNTAERMRIFAGGNVGINTTTDAGFKLDVNGTARVGSSSISYSNALLTLTSDQGSANFRIGGGSTVYCSSSFSAVVLSSNDYISGSRVLLGGARINAPTTDWLSVTNASQSANGNGNLSVNLATFGTTYATINASAQVEIASTTKGFLPPRMTTTQKNAIASPATGLQVYDTTLNQMSYYNGTTWTNI